MRTLFRLSTVLRFTAVVIAVGVWRDTAFTISKKTTATRQSLMRVWLANARVLSRLERTDGRLEIVPQQQSHENGSSVSRPRTDHLRDDDRAADRAIWRGEVSRVFAENRTAAYVSGFGSCPSRSRGQKI